jgi:hypothetical protein
MNTEQGVKADERTVTVLRGNTWAYNFIVLGLLIDILYRGSVFREAAWDLFALVFASGAISMAYATRHKVMVLKRYSITVIALGAFVAAIVAFVLAATRAM